MARQAAADGIEAETAVEDLGEEELARHLSADLFERLARLVAAGALVQATADFFLREQTTAGMLALAETGLVAATSIFHSSRRSIDEFYPHRVINSSIVAPPAANPAAEARPGEQGPRPRMDDSRPRTPG